MKIVHHSEEKVRKVHHGEEESMQSEEEPAHHSKEELRKPYVISEDIHILLENWAKKKGFTLPSRKFFRQLRKDMEKHMSGIFGTGNVHMVSVEELRNGMKELLEEIDIPVVSLDRTYIRTNPELQITRMTDESLNDLGKGPRFGAPPLQEQYATVAAKYKEVALLDDVIYSGGSMVDTIQGLEVEGARVPIVIIGITKEEGAKRIKEKTGAEVLTVRYYENLTDEVCERDFYPGVPLSGRYIVGMPIDVGAPYTHPFDVNPNGKALLEKWGSIPEHKQTEFSIFCLKQSIRLWEEIENLSQKTVHCYDLERVPLGFHHRHHYKSRFVDCLKN